MMQSDRRGRVPDRKMDSVQKTENGLVEVQEIVGDPTRGTIYWLKNIHSHPNYYAHDILRLGRLQAVILDRLCEMQLQSVFYEPVGESILGQSPDRVEKLFALHKSIHRDYPELHPQCSIESLLDKGRVRKDLSEEQLTLIGLVEAPLLYAQLFPHVSLLKTQTKAEWDVISRTLSNSQALDPSKVMAFSSEREGWAVREMMSYLTNNPGQRVALVYGVMHDFPARFNALVQSDSRPTFISNHWPDLRREFNRSCTLAVHTSLVQCQGIAQTQGEIIRNAEVIPFGAFGAIAGEALQLLALDKLIIDQSYARQFSKQQLFEYLIYCAASRRVAAKVRQLEQKNEGVFRSYLK